jgi:hypothetical protein
LLDEEERRQLLADLGICDEKNLEVFSRTTVLAAIVARRKPFVRMMSEVADVLAELNAHLSGNVQIVTLPDSSGQMRFAFGSQVRQYLALCADEEVFRDVVSDLYALLLQCRTCIDKAMEECAPQLVYVTPSMVPSSDDVPYSVARRALRRPRELFNPEDVTFFGEVRRMLGAISDIAERFAVELSETVPLSFFRRELCELTESVAEKAAVMARQLDVDGSTWPQLAGADERAVLEQLRLLSEGLASVAKREKSFAGLVDFLSLEIWRQRWRLFEVWSLCRVVRVILARGGVVQASSRIKEGEWTLKYASDSQPCLEVLLNGTPLHLFYQLRRSSGGAAHMPDIALEMPGTGFILVADPKHGKSYTRSKMEKVCRRYRYAFKPVLSCVMNYFPGNEGWRNLDGHVGMVVATGMTPDSHTALLFSSAIDDALEQAWEQSRLPRLSRHLMILFDVSLSTCEIRASMADDVVARIASATWTENSRLLPFADEVRDPLSLGSVTRDAQSLGECGESTRVTHAFDFALRKLHNCHGRREIWIYTDGEDALAADSVENALRDGIRVIAFHCRRGGMRLLLPEHPNASNVDYG